MEKTFITAAELYACGSKLQTLCQRLADRINDEKLSDDYREFFYANYYRWLGVREFLSALSHDELESFMHDAELISLLKSKEGTK